MIKIWKLRFHLGTNIIRELGFILITPALASSRKYKSSSVINYFFLKNLFLHIFGMYIEHKKYIGKSLKH